MPDLKRIETWEATRSIEMPWINALTPAQVLELREEASDALPRLRALVGKHIGRSDDDTDERVLQLVHDLRAETAEVEAELRSLRWAKQRGFRTLSGTLGITIAVYGVTAGFLPVGVALGSLLSLLGIVRSAERQDQKEHDSLAARPGYVLLKARELLEHRH